MKFRSAFAVLSMTVALTACGKLPFQTTDEPAAPAHSGPPTVSPLDQPIETGGEGTALATAEASTMGTAMFRAAGSGWTVTAADKTAVYERTGAKSTAVTVRRMTYGRGVEFIGTMNGQVFSLNVRAQECDSGAGKTPFSANLRVGSQRLTGCAAPTDIMPKAQVKASSAAPKPKSTPKPAPAATPAAEKPPVPAAATTPSPATPAPATASPTAPAATTPEPTTPAATAPATSTVTTPTATTPATPAPETAPAAAAPAATTPEPAAPATTPTPAATDTAPATPVVPPAPEAATE